MIATNRARLGMIGLMFDLYDRWPDLKIQEAQFAGELVQAFSPFAAVDFPGVCTTHEQVDEALRRFEAEGKDLVLVVLLTYAPSHIALRGLLKTSLPILILNTQQLYEITSGTTGDDTTRNHGMHGVQDLTNVLLRAGRSFQVVTGHYPRPAHNRRGARLVRCRPPRAPASPHPHRAGRLRHGGHGRFWLG